MPAVRTEQLRRLFLALREPLAIFLGFRLGLAVLAFFAGVLFPPIARGGTAPYMLPLLNRWGERLLAVWSHWDGEWYLRIAQNGYQARDGTSAFFPLYPLLVKLLAFLLAGNYLLAGVIISTAATLAVFVLFYDLVRRDLTEPVARRATLYLAAFPTAFFLPAIYSESLFLALVLGAFGLARHHQKWGWVGLLLALATLTRSLGVLLIIPLAWEWWQSQQQNRLPFSLPFRRLRPEHTAGVSYAQANSFSAPTLALLTLGLAAGLAIGGWLIFNWLYLDDPLNFLKIQSEYPWNRHTSPPWETLLKGAQLFLAARGPDGFLPASYREDPNLIDFPFLVFFGLLFLAACWQSWRGRLPLSYLLYFGLGLLFPLLSPTPKQPLLSFPRFGLLLFPAFIVLAGWGERWPWLHYLYLYGSLLLLGLFFSRFANWYWIA